jgi:hypothetical protein
MAIHLEKFIHTSTGRIMMSLILGFGLASLFRAVCKDNNCLTFYAPPIDELKEKIYKSKDKCVQYVPVPTKCSLNSKVLTFE